MPPTPTEITLKRPKFDRAAPVPERVMHGILATGVGRAPTRRLLGAFVSGGVGAVAILLIAPRWWVVATPLICLTAVSGWGLTTKRLFIFQLHGGARPAARLLLEAMRAAMAVIGVTAALAGAAGFVRLLLRP
jgi:hypothetical protein